MTARLLCLLVVLSIALIGCRSEEPSPDGGGVPARTAAEAAYVGDEACASCHEDLYAAYHRTGMGRSVSRFDAATAPERFGPQARIYDAATDFYYEPFVRGDTLYQREFRLDAEGAVIYERTHAAAYVVGSGNATRSYLMDTNGHVTEMPLTWYVDRARWDLSPGYEQTNLRFDRPISLECMTCHNGIPEHSPFTQSHYTDVPRGITCERCHGPGGDHVEARLEGFEPPEGTPDPDVVNPAHLEPAQRQAVCQQCHLTGISVFRPGEDPTTFRPGQPLAAHHTVFATEEELTDPERFGIASHAARLAQSACYRESALTCTTCHDPHRPVAELGADHFNDVCRSCHEGAEDEPVCSRPGAHGAEAMTGDCVSCHLQASGTDDIPHVTFTDHWIRRTLPAPRRPEAIDRMRVREEPFVLVPVEGAAEGPAALLDEAIAYFEFYETRHRHAGYLPEVIRRARAGLAAGAEHVEARLALGRALAAMDSLAAAEAVLAEAATRYPEHARALYWLGDVRLRRGRPADALPPLERAVAVQPAFVEAQVKRAEALAGSGRLAEAAAAYRAALDADPVHLPGAWNDLGFLLLQQNRMAEATPLFERAVALDPDLVPALVNLGSVRMLAGALDDAAAHFEQALRQEPDHLPALGNLGLVYAQLGRYEEARERLRRVLALAPGDARAAAALDQVEQRIRERS